MRNIVERDGRPFSMVEPGTRVGKPFGFEPPEVAYGALQAHRGWVQLSHRRKALIFAGETEQAEIAAVNDRHVDLIALGPETEQRPLSVR